MAIPRHRANPILVLMLAVVTPATAAAADAPMPLARDQAWVYRQTTESGGKVTEVARSEVSIGWSNRAGNWVAFIRTMPVAPGADAGAPVSRMLGLIDGHGCLTDTVNAVVLQYRPCTTVPGPDATWTIARPGDQRRTFKAAGREALHVAAGTFEARRIEEVDAGILVTDGNVRKEVATSRSVYWFVPEVGAMARVERESLRPDGTVAMRQVDVLESFGAVSEDARLAARATPQWQAYERTQALRARIATLRAQSDTLTRQARMTAEPECRPEYPAAAVRAMATGETRLVMLVDADGAVEGSEIVGASGPTREHQLLDAAAQDSLARCSFAPALGADGRPTPSAVVVSYTWRLE